MEKEIVYLGLGSNLGNREQNLEDIITFLQEKGTVKVLEKSSIYETEPWGVLEQDKFLNCVLAVETNLEPMELLLFVKEIERRLLRREDAMRWGPRTADIDILIYGTRKVDTQSLVIPHVSMWEREFVLVPLAEIAPEMISPDGRNLAEYVEALGYKSNTVRKQTDTRQ